MIAGVQPFKALTSYLSMEKTKKAEYKIPPGFDPLAKDLVAKLLVVDPSERLGDIARGGPKEIREHPFFEDVRWDELWTNVDAPPLEAGLVKKEPPPPRHRNRSQQRSMSRPPAQARNGNISNGGPYEGDHEEEEEGDSNGDDTESNSDDAFNDVLDGDDISSDPDDDEENDDSDSGSQKKSGTRSRRSEAWAAVVQNLSEDEMDDERAHRRGRRTPSQSSINDDDDNDDGEGTDDGTVGAPSQSRDVSPDGERGRSHLPSELSTSLPGDVIAWDAHYGNPAPSSRVGLSIPSNANANEEIRADSGGGSPVSSAATSSTGRSEGQASWCVPTTLLPHFL